MKSKFHHIVRAIMIQDEKLLVAEYIGHHYFLPGGHVEIGESAENALIRELREELGVTCSIKQFLGVIENQWQAKETLHHEINHIFEIDSNELKSDFTPISKESHLAFHWIDFNNENINSYTIMPTPSVKELLERKLSDELLTCWISNC
ncbi:NUDIX domain-containing protein [Bacillus mycoides]|uniref:NUDIX domain-containing protein n=1 Tax=Bacillus mycoides TaxID=1405 RepID=UPI000B4B186E|nr:NUDIX domain-containing protein [Bacillus mycoides]